MPEPIRDPAPFSGLAAPWVKPSAACCQPSGTELPPGRSCGSGGRSDPSLLPSSRWWRQLLTRAANARLLPCSCCRPSTAGSTEAWGRRGRPRSPSCCSTWKVKCRWEGEAGGEGGGQENAAAPARRRGIVPSSPALAPLPFPFQGAGAEAGGSCPLASVQPRGWAGPLMSPRRAGLGITQGWCLGEGRDWCSWRGCSPRLWRTKSPGQARFAAAVPGSSLGEGLEMGKRQWVVREKTCVGTGWLELFWELQSLRGDLLRPVRPSPD